MISLTDASFQYVGGRKIFQNVSLNVKLGETLGILGANGVGKTTLIKCMMNFLKFNTGRLFIDNKARETISASSFWKTVGYVPQARNMAFGYSVLEMTVMGLSPYINMGGLPKKEEYEKAEEILDYLGIQNIKNSSCNKISGGQLQMVLIARTLIKQPKILIMDEPESSLDLKNQMKIINIIESLNARGKMAIIINTHFPSHALRIADNSLIIGNGAHVYGNTKDVITKDTLRTHFGIEAEILESKRDNKSLFLVFPIALSQASN